MSKRNWQGHHFSPVFVKTEALTVSESSFPGNVLVGHK